MSFVGSNILAGASGQGGAGYAIERSVRFNSSDTPKITRTPGSAGNQKTWTLSFWMKRTTTGSREQILSAAGTHNTYVEFQNDKLMIEDHDPGLNFILKTTRVFRDPSSWYSVIVSVDTTQATASNRIKLYINGVQETAFDSSTYPSQNYETSFNDTGEHKFGQFPGNTSFPFNGYLADVHFIDGQALAPTDFGETDDNGVWQPKEFEGNYVSTYSGTTTSLSQTGWNPSQSGNIWDGNASSASRATGYAGGTKGTVSFYPPLTNVIKVEVWTQNYVNYLNGASVSTPESINGGWHTFYDNSGSPITLNSVGNAYDTNNTQTVDIAGIRINGSIVDSQTWTPPSGVGLGDSGANSFHLDFADNSSNAALGTDTSGNSNTWTVNNLTASVGAPTDAIAFDGDDKLTFSGPGSITGDCTIECFIKAASYAGSHKRIISADEASQAPQFTLIRSYNNRLYFIFGSSGDSVTNNFVAPSTNEWHHIAMTRSGTTVSYFMDGTRLGTSSHTGGTINITSTVLAWGYGSEYFTGEISNARIVDGQALYTGSTYTVPTADLTTTSQGATSSYVTHLLANTSTVTANGGTGSAGTAGGNPAVVTASPFGDPVNIDSLVDTPTNAAEPTDTGAGGEITGNYATLNPLAKSSGVTLSNGNLDASVGGDPSKVLSTIGMTSGKYYAEFAVSSGSINPGLATSATNLGSGFLGNDAGGWCYGANGKKYHNDPGASGATYGATYTTGDVIGVAFDADGGNLTFYKNGTTQGVAYTGLTSGPYFFAAGGSSSSYATNFGQRAFSHPLSGYKSLNTANLSSTIADGSQYFDTKLYTGNAGTNAQTGLGFSPDLLWLKVRSQAFNHNLFDSVRGNTKHLSSNLTNAEYTESSGRGLTAFDSNGFTLGQDVQGPGSVNASGQTYAGWAWDAGTTGANEVGSYWSPAYNTKYIGFKFPTGSGGRAVFGLVSGTGTADIYTSTDNSSWTRVQTNVTLSATDTTYDSSDQYLLVVNTSNAVWSAHHYAMATNGTDAHYSTATYPGSGASFTWSGPGYTDWDFRSSGTVIKPGGLNSSLYNQSYAITSNITGASSLGGTLANWFNGQRANKLEPSASGSLDFTGVSALQNFSGTLQFAVSAYSGSTSMKFVINASTDNLTFTTNTLPSSSGGFPSQLLTIPVTSLRTLDFTSISGQSTQFWGMYLNGKLLVDSTATPDNVPSIASTVRANPSAGFSIVTATISGGGSIGHGLNAKPHIVIRKRRDGSGDHWYVAVDTGSVEGYLLLNTNVNLTSESQGLTSSTFNAAWIGNANETWVNYCFAPVEGYSAMGSYSSGSDPFVFTGFSPRFVLLKKTNAVGHWYMFDSERGPINPNETWLEANGSGAEQTHANGDIRFLSNGFQPIGSDIDAGGGTYIYYAVSENPFKTARAR
jgi:hypothetical protein